MALSTTTGYISGDARRQLPDMDRFLEFSLLLLHCRLPGLSPPILSGSSGGELPWCGGSGGAGGLVDAGGSGEVALLVVSVVRTRLWCLLSLVRRRLPRLMKVPVMRRTRPPRRRSGSPD
jgi:hypothetical protein